MGKVTWCTRAYQRVRRDDVERQEQSRQQRGKVVVGEVLEHVAHGGVTEGEVPRHGSAGVQNCAQDNGDDHGEGKARDAAVLELLVVPRT